MRNFRRRPRVGISLSMAMTTFLLCGSIISDARAQRRRRAGASPPRGQTSFNLEEPVSRPVPIPADVLRGLGQDERVLSCLSGADQSAVEIPPSWFAASAINLNGDQLPDLIIKPVNSCLFGANIGPFWVFRNTGKGYALALRTDALELEVLPTKTRNYRNIRASAASARQVFKRLYRFDGQSYRPSRR